MEYLQEYRRLVGVGASLLEKEAGTDGAMLDTLTSAFSTKVASQDVKFIRYRKLGDSIELEDQAARLGGILTSVESDDVDLGKFTVFLKKHGAKPLKATEEGVDYLRELKFDDSEIDPEKHGKPGSPYYRIQAHDAGTMYKVWEFKTKSEVGDYARELASSIKAKSPKWAWIEITLNRKVPPKVNPKGLSFTQSVLAAYYTLRQGRWVQTQGSVKISGLDEASPLAGLMAMGDQSAVEDEANAKIIQAFKKSVHVWTDYLGKLTGTTWRADPGELTVDFNEAFGKKRSIGVYWDIDVGSDNVVFYVEGPRGTGTQIFQRKTMVTPSKPGAPKEFFGWLEKTLQEAVGSRS